jgi:hypothetical protein
MVESEDRRGRGIARNIGFWRSTNAPPPERSPQAAKVTTTRWPCAGDPLVLIMLPETPNSPKGCRAPLRLPRGNSILPDPNACVRRLGQGHTTVLEMPSPSHPQPSTPFDGPLVITTRTYSGFELGSLLHIAWDCSMMRQYDPPGTRTLGARVIALKKATRSGIYRSALACMARFTRPSAAPGSILLLSCVASAQRRAKSRENRSTSARSCGANALCRATNLRTSSDCRIRRTGRYRSVICCRSGSRKSQPKRTRASVTTRRIT